MEGIMASSGQITGTALDDLLRDGTLAGTWTLDPTRSTVTLRSKSMWGLVAVKGVFGRIQGQGTVSATGEASGTITVASDSIDTKMKKRDEHLRSADFFDAAAHPAITFTADQVRPSGHGVTVTGSLTVRGTTRPLSFGAQVSSTSDSEVWLDGEFAVNRADFGLTWNQLGMASMHTTITVHAVFTRS
jgi:polyisoprenoid-binding protein YceI